MASINLIRVDFRLIHGQVITKWSKRVNANRMVIIDDKLANDPFMKDIYAMAAPTGISVEAYTLQDAVNMWKENEFGNGRLLVLFKSVTSAYEALKQGLPIQELQIGGLGGGPGRINVFSAISLDAEDVRQLREMEKMGTEVVLHIVPEEPRVPLEKAIKKFNF
ncbi:PTS sugar transporter subunit IIB [Irregularibacter muris]|uniref:PTS sugar transporter subunit IIB n=1 Tax=Irregularibacter muris TaxID=1796619 RepID=A0AAE3HIL8_9FIRM|nr:PTS sugar transporter subunit IIB [Irregularibacter muris]MCR1900005.1 PTS sugar transporter subunit IIB [Irregularibacter muris]